MPYYMRIKAGCFCGRKGKWFRSEVRGKRAHPPCGPHTRGQQRKGWHKETQVSVSARDKGHAL